MTALKKLDAIEKELDLVMPQIVNNAGQRAKVTLRRPDAFDPHVGAILDESVKALQKMIDAGKVTVDAKGDVHAS